MRTEAVVRRGKRDSAPDGSGSVTSDRGLEFGEGAGVEDMGGFEPAAAGGCDSVTHVVEVLRAVGVGIDGETATFGIGGANEGAVEVEPFGAGIDFEKDVAAGCFGGHAVEVVNVGFALQENAAGHVTHDL